SGQPALEKSSKLLRPAMGDRDILALGVAGFANALPECGQIACTISKRRPAEKSDHPHRASIDQAAGFRTFQVCPKDLRAALRNKWRYGRVCSPDRIVLR